MIIRDASGGFITARSVLVSGIVQVKEAEALGLLEVARWVKYLNIHNIIFEMDAKIVVDSFLLCTYEFN